MKIVAFLVGFSSLVLGAKADCCKNGWLSYEGHCYYIGYETLLTFHSAWAYCNTRGAYLVRLETPGEYLFVKEYLKKTGARTPWIGLTDMYSEGKWQWMDTGKHIRFSDWAYGQPDNAGDEDCVHLNSYMKFKWNDVRCNYKFIPLCEYDLS